MVEGGATTESGIKASSSVACADSSMKRADQWRGVEGFSESDGSGGLMDVKRECCKTARSELVIRP